jgi:hypothetical protein
MVVFLATPVPLFEGVRPNPEPGPGYLNALDERLAQIGKSHGAGTISVDFLQITTHPKR